MLTIINIGLYMVLQIGTMLFFKWGAVTPNRYWWGFVIGNLFGLFSTFAYVNVFKYLNGNLAVAICSGGAFVVVQIAMAWFNRHPLSWPSVLGAFLIVAGITLMALFTKA